MTTHLTARITWHDSGNNGRICAAPHRNVACRGHEWIGEWFADATNADAEIAAAGQTVAPLKFRPPCWRDVSAFGETGFVAYHEDPLPGRELPPAREEVPPYSLCPSPYRWMLEANFEEICREENLSIRGSQKDQPGTWVMEADRQRDLLARFWGKLDPKHSLIFFYHNQQNAVDEGCVRLLAGVATITEIAKPIYFGSSPKMPGNFPVWSRRVSHSWPTGGVRIPYQAYIDAGADPSRIACPPPADAFSPFMYVAEHMSDGQAVSALSAIIKTIEKVRDDDLVKGDWASALGWLDVALNACWKGRGAYPGVGSVLRFLGCSRGAAFQREILREVEAKGDDPWGYTKRIFSRVTIPPPGYAEALEPAITKWRQIPNKHELIDLMVRMELTEAQVTGVVDDIQRDKRGLKASPARICENPYLLSEQDEGLLGSEPISLEAVDQAVIPEGAAAAFRTNAPALDDVRRVRATAKAVLRLAADTGGDTVLPLPDLIERIRGYFPERRACTVDSEAFWSDEQRQFHAKILSLDEVAAVKAVDAPQSTGDFDEDLDDDETSQPGYLKIVGLKRVRADENLIAEIIRQAGPTPTRGEMPDWSALLGDPAKGGFPEPASARARQALQEKERALEILWNERISVLTGGAGTGKTSVVKVFLSGLFSVEGRQTLLLTAPTGKARVRLETKTGLRANTIHQILHRAGMVGADFRLRREPTKPKSNYKTVVIDECSMPSVELLAGLFKAVETQSIQRLILVGDPYQLPPIGPGRPFFDIIRWLRENRPGAVADLVTSMRVQSSDDGTEQASFGLELAAAFRGEKAPGEDGVFSRLAATGVCGDARLRTWNTPEDLETALYHALSEDLPARVANQEEFDRSLGVQTLDASRAEGWQILSPTRIHPHGTDALNRNVQTRFRWSELHKARDWRTIWPKPFGEAEIVYKDKVLQAHNAAKWKPKGDPGLGFVANGEIGLVVSAFKGKDSKPDNLKAQFSTQPGSTYSYSRAEVDRDGQLELAYALTVHKAQGSDFESVIFIVPKASATLSRELLYTGLTRFTGRVILLVQEDLNSLLSQRTVGASDTLRRTTMMFGFAPGVPPDTQADVYAPYRPEGLIHRTSTGVAVRSKSEIVVADLLTHNGLIWTYEEPLRGISGLASDFRIPDFTIRYGGRTWYWEHLGMLDRPGYREKWGEKKDWYANNGYAGSLVTSEESPTGGFHADEVSRIIEREILGR